MGPAGLSEKGKGVPTPLFTLKHSIVACCAVLMLLLILYNFHCQQTNITSPNSQDTAMGGTIP